MSINISKEIEIDKLNRIVYRFLIMDLNIFLKEIEILKRESTRHKFKTTKHYDRHNQKNSIIKKEEIKLSDELKQEVLNELISKLKIIID